MKALIISIILIISTYTSSFSQQLATLNDVTQIELPQSFHKSATSNRRLRTSLSKLPNVIEKGSFYQGDDVEINIVTAFGQAKDNYLEDIQKGQADLHKALNYTPKNYTSTIRKINNFKVLLMSYDLGEVSHVSLLSLSTTGKSALNASFDCPLAAKAKMGAIVNRILNSMQFKR